MESARASRLLPRRVYKWGRKSHDTEGQCNATGEKSGFFMFANKRKSEGPVILQEKNQTLCKSLSIFFDFHRKARL